MRGASFNAAEQAFVDALRAGKIGEYAVQNGPLVAVGPSSPPEVIGKLQSSLRSAGIDLDVDGIWGPGTQRALREYQAASGLSVDGFAGTDVLTSLQANANRGRQLAQRNPAALDELMRGAQPRPRLTGPMSMMPTIRPSLAPSNPMMASMPSRTPASAPAGVRGVGGAPLPSSIQAPSVERLGPLQQAARMQAMRSAPQLASNRAPMDLNGGLAASQSANAEQRIAGGFGNVRRPDVDQWREVTRRAQGLPLSTLRSVDTSWTSSAAPVPQRARAEFQPTVRLGMQTSAAPIPGSPTSASATSRAIRGRVSIEAGAKPGGRTAAPVGSASAHPQAIVQRPETSASASLRPAPQAYASFDPSTGRPVPQRIGTGFSDSSTNEERLCALENQLDDVRNQIEEAFDVKSEAEHRYFALRPRAPERPAMPKEVQALWAKIAVGELALLSREAPNHPVVVWERETSGAYTAALRAWRTECSKAEVTSGSRAAEREVVKALGRAHSIARRMTAIRASTLEGIMVKLRLRNSLYKDCEELLVELLESIAVDIEAMAESRGTYTQIPRGGGPAIT